MPAGMSHLHEVITLVLRMKASSFQVTSLEPGGLRLMCHVHISDPLTTLVSSSFMGDFHPSTQNVVAAFLVSVSFSMQDEALTGEDKQYMATESASFSQENNSFFGT